MPFTVIVYDVAIERVNTVKKTLREYLKWEQNSVLTGDLTPAQIREVKDRLLGIIEPSEDHVIIFQIRDRVFVNREDLGTPKGQPEEDAWLV